MSSGLTVQALLRRVELFTLKLFVTAIEEGQIGRAAAVLLRGGRSAGRPGCAQRRRCGRRLRPSAHSNNSTVFTSNVLIAFVNMKKG